MALMFLAYVLFLLSIAISIVAVIGAVFVYLTTKREPDNEVHDSEKFFVNPKNGSTNPFPSIDERGTLTLSVIVPAYNEEKRLPPMLDECLDYLENRTKIDPSFTYEVIVVDDGSSDKTTTVALKYCDKYGVDKLRVLTLFKNRGKGGAVRMGMTRSRGCLLLFADADGATKFSDLDKLEDSLEACIGTNDPEKSLAIIVGSRAHLEEEAIASRSAFRTFLMHGFHFLVWLLCVRSIRDTQCGFKLLTREAARVCFSNLHINRWAFDVELLYIAEHLKMKLKEVAVVWTEIEGSKIIPFWSWLQMGKDLMLLWLRYQIGAWKIVANNKKIK
ncbi:dolichyl-phosphate beta-glucosyltransferase [Chamberlinius hualienensis]